MTSNCGPQLPDDSNPVTRTPQPQHTLTPTPAPSETTTLTYTPTNVPTHLSTITWTPLPTMLAYERDEKISMLLETNGGCELPCWWGIIPNKTPWAEALHFLSSFISDNDRGTIHYLTPDNEETEIWFGIRDGLVSDITVFPPSTQYKYQLHQLLSLLGIPKDVYIVAQSSSPVPGLPPAGLILDYSEIGIWAAYKFVPSAIDENLYVCPQRVGPRLELFDPTTGITYLGSKEELIATLGDHTGFPQKIEAVTNMTTDVFYNTFINPTSNACLETPANLWP